MINTFQHSHFPKGLSIMKKNYIEDGLNQDLSTTLHENEVQKNSYANMKCQRKSDSYVNQYNLEMANSKFSLFDQILKNDELLQTYNSAILYNVHIMQVDEKISSNRIYHDNEIYDHDEGKTIENTNRCMDWMNNNVLNEFFFNSVCHNLIKENILNDKSHHLPQQFSALTNMKATSCIEDSEENIQQESIDSQSNIIDTRNNYKELKKNSIKCLGDDVINDDKTINVKNTINPSVANEISEEVLAYDMIAKTNDNKDLLCSIIECDGNEFPNSSKLLPDAKAKQICLKKFKILESQDCSSLLSLIELQRVTSNILTKESQHDLDTKSYEEKDQQHLHTKCEEIIRQNFLVKENVSKQEILYQDYQLESSILKPHLTVLQFAIQDLRSDIEPFYCSNIQNDIFNENDNYEHNVSKNSQENLNHNLNDFFVTNYENKNNGVSEHINSMPFEIDPYTSNTDDKNLSDRITNNAIMIIETPEVVNLQMTTCDNDNTLKILSLENQNEHKNFKIDSVANFNCSFFPMVEDTIHLKDLSLLEESIKNTNEHLNSFRSYSSLNEKKCFNQNVLNAKHTNEKVTFNNNTKVNDGNESSTSQSYCITPEDGGILRNKRHRIDDVFQNEKSFKLKSFEQSLDSLSEKSRTYKKLYMKKIHDSYNLPETSNFHMTSLLMSTKHDVKDSSKVNALYPSNPYSLSKQDCNKKKIKTLYPCNPYPQKNKEFDNKKLHNKSKKNESKVIDHSIGYKFEKQHVSQPLFEIKNENTNLSPLRRESYLSANQVCNSESVLRNKPNFLQYSKKNQFIEDDKVFFQSKRIQFHHNEHEDDKNDIFMPFLFDDANFSIPSKNCNFQIPNASCHEEHKKISSNLKKTVVITPDTCMISTTCLQCQQIPQWFTQSKEISNPIVIPTTHKNGDHSTNNGSKQQNSQEIEIPYFVEGIKVERIESHIIPHRKDDKEMEGNKSIENEHKIKVERLEEEFIQIDENLSEKKDKYKKPCCCDPSQGHATTCYQYVPNYEPPKVTRIKNTRILDNSKACMTCGDQCYQRYIALRRARSQIPNYNDQCQHQLNTLRKARKYCLSHLQSCRNVDEGDVNIESNVSARTNTSNNVEKSCEYDRIGRYRKSENLRSKSRQKWKKN